MTYEQGPPTEPTEELSEYQQMILYGFYSAYKPQPASLQETAEIDQSIASMRDTINNGFHLKLDSMREYYAVMAGISVATQHMQVYMQWGMSPAEASNAIQNAYAGLLEQTPEAPEE